MATVRLETARETDRDELVEALRRRGFEARPTEGAGAPGVEVPCDAREDLLAGIETWLAEADLPLVPVPVGDRVYLRPPGE